MPIKEGLSHMTRYVGSKVRYDGASFFGALLCLMSLFVPWVLRPLEYPYHLPYPWHSWMRIQTTWSFTDLLLDPAFTLVMSLFLTGTVLSLFFRFGVIPQIFGLLGFLMVAPGHFTPSLPTTVLMARLNHVLGPGYFLALAGVLISAFLVRNFWWQRSTTGVVPSISRVAALAPNSTRSSR